MMRQTLVLARRQATKGTNANPLATTRRAFSTKKVGFVGLGNMGLPMCQNLKTKSEGKYDVTAFDKFPAAMERAEKEGIATASKHGLEQLAKESDIIVSMLFNTDTSFEVYRDNVFKHARPGTVFLDCTTIAPAAAKELGEDAVSRGFRMADAPVSGGVTGAAQGTLAFMAGCPNDAQSNGQEEFNNIFKPVLAHMGPAERIFYCGGNGTGSIAKVCNNMALAIQMISVAEALSLGGKLGMDETLLSNVMCQSSSRCWSIDAYNPFPGVMPNVPASRNYDGGFKNALMVKDLKLAIEECATSCNADVEFGAKALEYYRGMCEDSFADKDFGMVYKYVHANKKNVKALM